MSSAGTTEAAAAIFADLFPDGVVLMLAVAHAELGRLYNDSGRCRACGERFPCRRACLAEHILGWFSSWAAARARKRHFPRVALLLLPETGLVLSSGVLPRSAAIPRSTGFPAPALPPPWGGRLAGQVTRLTAAGAGELPR